MAYKVRVPKSAKVAPRLKKVRVEDVQDVQALGAKDRDANDKADAAGHHSGGLGSTGLIIGGLAVAGGAAAAAAGGGNKAPVYSSATQSATVAEDGTVTVSAPATDKDPLTYSASTPANGTVTVSGSSFTYTPKKDFNGTDTFTVTASDGKLSASQTVTVTVTPVNDAPVITSGGTATVAENAAVSTVVYTAAATDVDTGDTKTFSLSGADAAAFNIDAATGAVTLKASADFEAKASYNINVVATDKAGATATQAVVVTVTNVNEAPTVTSGATATVAENAAASTVIYTATATDPDAGDTKTFSLSGTDAASFNIDAATGAVTLKASADFEAKSSYSVNVVATDRAGLTGSKALTVSVTNVNEAPTFSAATQSVSATEDVAKAVTLGASDVDAGDVLTYTVSTAAAHGTVTVSGSTATYTPNANYNGSDSFVVTVTDAGGLTATQTVNLTVAAVNDAPTFSASTQSVSATEDVAKGVALAASDVDGDTLTYTVSTAAAHGTVTVSGSTATYTPNANYNGSDSFVVTVSDGNGGTATQTVSLTVAAVDDSIDVTDDTAAVTYTATAGVVDVFTDNSNQKTNAIITGMTSGDSVVVTGASADYSFTSVGSDIQITYNNTAAGVLNVIVLKGLAGTSYVSDEASAEAAAGWNFFTAQTQPSGSGTSGTAGAGGNLDADSDADALTQAVVTATGANSYTEDANVANYVKINGFGSDDTITVSNALTSAYSFTSSGTDIHITYTTSGGVVNDITLVGVVTSGTFIGSEADAETALGRDFFKNATASESATSISLDVGSATSTSTVSGAGAAVTFTDSATTNSYVKITDFTSGDVIQVTGATESQYSFSTADLDADGSADDLSITYSNAGVVNDIQILNVVSPTAFVFDKASAVSAVGFNFITFG